MSHIKDIFQSLASFKRRNKQFALIFSDIFILNFALWIAFSLRFSNPFTIEYIVLNKLLNLAENKTQRTKLIIKE